MPVRAYLDQQGNQLVDVAAASDLKPGHLISRVDTPTPQYGKTNLRLLSVSGLSRHYRSQVGF